MSASRSPGRAWVSNSCHLSCLPGGDFQVWLRGDSVGHPWGKPSRHVPCDEVDPALPAHLSWQQWLWTGMMIKTFLKRYHQLQRPKGLWALCVQVESLQKQRGWVVWLPRQALELEHCAARHAAILRTHQGEARRRNMATHPFIGKSQMLKRDPVFL